jgi:sulfate adenylyltransferase subunit 1
MEVLRFLTAGSVDDGKSTLIGRLLYDTRAILADQLDALERTSRKRGTPLDLSLLTDGLAAEREQGITIDVAWRYFATPRRKFIVADAPGHAQYTRNMVTAASTADLAVLLVDARHGVLAQTRRHATLAHLLGVPHLVVAVNKMDLAGYDRARFDAIVADFRAFAARSGIGAARFVPMSASNGDMVVERGERLVWYDGPTLLRLLETVDVESALDRAPLRFPVQLVQRPADGGARRYLGRVEAGTVSVGDRVAVLPSGRDTRVRAIHSYDAPLEHAGLHASIALELDDALDVSRGDLIVRAGEAPPVVSRLAADLAWLADAPLDPRRTYVLRHATREVRARVESLAWRWDVETQTRDLHPPTLDANGIGRVSLALGAPIASDDYRAIRPTGAFLLIDEASHATVAAGMVHA